jgi:diguanylate cyclase (GGDEF)-like protein
MVRRDGLCGMKLDWSSRGRARAVFLTVVGTLICIAFAFAFDSYSFASGVWRWGSDPLNNLIIPLALAPPFLFYLLNNTRQLAIAHHELMTIAATDSLTSLLNRRAFTEMVDGYLKSIQEISRPSSAALMVIDVDHFKSVNDRFGHDCGDEALQLVAETIRACVRETDLVGRIGGEEFGVFIPEGPPKRVPIVAERIRAAIADADFVAEGQRQPLSVSVGGVLFNQKVPYSDLYRGADQLLYRAKENGRNRIELRMFDPHAMTQSAAG